MDVTMDGESGAAGLGPTLRAWRERLQPGTIGLPARPPSGRKRRAAGLRREELAELAGLSVDYVVRLEQGRATTPSAQVMTAMARALQLTAAERDHLFRLAQLIPPGDGQISDHLPPSVVRVVARMHDTPVAVFAADWQLIWWNPVWAAVLGDPSCIPPALRNFAREFFPADQGGPSLSRWPVHTQDPAATAAAIVSDLRRATGRFPHDRRLAALIRDLTAQNAQFAGLWAAGTVGAHQQDRKIIDHPVVGPVTVDCDTLTDGEAELKIVIMSAAPGSEAETKVRLAAITGVQQPAP